MRFRWESRGFWTVLALKTQIVMDALMARFAVFLQASCGNPHRGPSPVPQRIRVRPPRRQGHLPRHGDGAAVRRPLSGSPVPRRRGPRRRGRPSRSSQRRLPYRREYFQSTSARKDIVWKSHVKTGNFLERRETLKFLRNNSLFSQLMICGVQKSLISGWYPVDIRPLDSVETWLFSSIFNFLISDHCLAGLASQTNNFSALTLSR